MTYAHFFAKLCQIVEKSGSITQIKIAGNPMFRSSSFHTIDPKGRIIIPARFRDVLKADDEYGVVVSIKDGCLYAYTFSEWKQLEKKFWLPKAQPWKNSNDFSWAMPAR